jgi:hypothetical protein
MKNNFNRKCKLGLVTKQNARAYTSGQIAMIRIGELLKTIEAETNK